jgi:hypothetical protein
MGKYYYIVFSIYERLKRYNYNPWCHAYFREIFSRGGVKRLALPAASAGDQPTLCFGYSIGQCKRTEL